MKKYRHKQRSSAGRQVAHSVYIVSLGCPKNLVDTEVMTGALLTAGFSLTMNPEAADLYLINTCAFIAPARSEAEAAIDEAVAWKMAAAAKRRIVVAGCLVKWDKDKSYYERYPEVDLWSGPDWVAEVGKQANRLFGSASTAERLLDADVSYLYDENTPRLQLTMPHIAYLKISEGCSNRCAYCAIPAIRGDLRSRSVASVVNEARNLRRNGVTELILIAQDSSAYANDLADAKQNLPTLLRELDRLDDGQYWIRVLYTHPASFSDELIQTIAETKHTLKYIDIPLQHIADFMLQRMRRHCDGSHIRKLLDKLRAQIPGVTIRTTFITGFPGETETMFEELRNFVAEQQFDRLGVFTYCPEPDTPAVAFADQVPAALAEQRRDILMALQKKISLNLNKSLVGRRLDVIVDIVENSRSAVGRSTHDAPEIDNLVKIVHQGQLNPGDIVTAEVTGAAAYSLNAVI